MALDLGELVGYLRLDDSQWDSTVDGLPDKASGKAGKFALAGGVLGGALAAALVQGVTDSMNFEATNATVAGQLGLTAEEAARVGNIAGSAYSNNFGESMESAQSVVGNLMTRIESLRTGSDEALESMTGKVLTYASAYGVETADAVNMVGQLLDTGLAGSAEEAMDLMTASMQKVPESLRGDLTDAINEYGPHLANLGYSGEEAFDLLVRGAEKGMYGIDKAGDAMKEFSIRGTDMSATSKEAYKAIGLDAQEMSNALLAGGDTAKEATDKIVAGLLAMEDPADQANTAIALFGTPLEDLSTADIPEFLTSLTDLGGGMEDAAGASQGMVDTLGGTAASQMEGFQRQVQMVFAELGENFLPVLTAVFGFMNEHQGIIPILVGALAALAIGLGIAAAAQWAMNSALLANPITWIIVGVMALIAAIVLLVANWDTVVAWLSDVWSAVVDWFKGTLDAIGEWWSGVWQAISDFFVGIWQGVRDFFVGLWQTLVGWFKAYINAYVSFWRTVWETVSGAFRAVWDTLVGWVKALVSGWLTGWRTLFSGLVTFFSGIWESISGGVESAWNGVLDFFEGIPATIKGFFTGIGSWLYNSGKDLVQGLLNGVKSLAGTIGSFFLDLLPGWIVGPFKAALGIHSPSRVFYEYGEDTVAGYLNAITDGRADLDAELRSLVDTEGLAVASTFSGSAQAQAAAASAQGSRTVNYYAAENRSLSAEEDLYAALSSPRVGGGLDG